ncbi:alpha-amylase family glycosyl hydrolase [Agarivorans sp. Alg241-V36]|uniref:alpha-amylase family glycosyl hydrolase n=1 Tax=Agarivorans sp. Alg241-V36 TaxID=2305992 RepID=UPI0013CF9BAF|nr:alpha-amylase family glycosyl hydrolase [Agarivorans sp. Alg241-V36]
MNKLTIALAGATLLSAPVAAEWNFRGTPNQWQSTPLAVVSGTEYTTCQTFGSNDPRFKIDRFGDWNEAYPSTDVRVDANKSYNISFFSDSKNISTTEVASCGEVVPPEDSWFYRGTSNGWAATAMASSDNINFCTTQSFANENPRFKIDHYGDWNEAYPTADFIVSGNASYQICFNADSKQITATPTTTEDTQAPTVSANPAAGSYTQTQQISLNVSDNQDSDPIIYCTTDGSIPTQASPQCNSASFTASDVVADGVDLSLKVLAVDASGNSAVSSFDYTISDAPADTWYFRGTPNDWQTTQMTTSDGENYCTTQSFGSNDPRFKVDHFGDWTENYPSADVTVNPDTTYEICFNATSKQVTTSEIEGEDTKAPVVSASPSGGSYTTAQQISLSVTDNQDPAPKLYCTTDGSLPTTALSPCNQQSFTANDVVSTGIDLVLKVLAVDADGNQGISTFNYTIDPTIITSGDFREENVYFIMTDRFADGDTSNNNIWGDEYLPNGEADKYNTNTSKTGPLSYYHGGDFQGIIDNLDYIQDMGFTAIWITPVVKQPEGRRFNASDDYEASAFHGYWGYDFDKIDPHLHSLGKDNDGWAGFDALVDALHSRGMKIMLDIVVNHGQPGQSVVGSKSKWADRALEIKMDGQTWNWETNDPYMDGAKNGFFSYASTGNTWLIDLLDFNEHGDDDQNATKHLINVYKRFIDHGVDAFRIDTVSYMTADFWERFTLEMDAHARSLGNDNFYMAGEAWTGDRKSAVDLIYNGQGKKFHMLDLHGSSMDFPGWMGKAFRGEAGFDDGNGYARIAGADGDASGIYDPTYLATFVDNHDVTRANGVLNETQYLNNLNFIYLFRGLPVVFYGTEVLYSSWPHYITTTEKDDVVARWMLGSEGINYAKTNQPTLYKHLKMLNSLRSSSEAIQKGQQIDLLLDGDHAAFARDNGAAVAYVALTKGSGFSYTFSNIANGSYRLITPNTDAASYNEEIVIVSGSSYSVDVPANSFVILDKQ